MLIYSGIGIKHAEAPVIGHPTYYFTLKFNNIPITTNPIPR